MLTALHQSNSNSDIYSPIQIKNNGNFHSFLNFNVGQTLHPDLSLEPPVKTFIVINVILEYN